MKENRFNSKVIFIVGATGGIGKNISKRFADEKAFLILFARDLEKLQNLEMELNTETLIVQGDAANYQDLENGVKLGIERFGRIDSLIHSVGSIVLKPIHNTEEETFRETMELNLISPFLAIKAVIRKMMSQKSGSIVLISSVAGSKGLVNHEAISAAKGGLEAMIRSASVTYAKRGIRFNGVALGLVETPMSKFLTENELSMKASTVMHPMGRIGKPDDVAEAILYLASNDSSWVTGAVIPVDGGMKAN